MPSRDISAEELVLNESFQHWVRRTSETDIAYWDKWLGEHPEHSATVTEAAQLVELLYSAAKPEVTDERIDRAIARVNARISQESKPATPAPRKSLPLRSTWSWQKLAAVWIGLLLVSIAAYWGVNQYFYAYVTYATAADETRQLQLPDGSTLVLNARSSVRFAREWPAGASREVWIDGEGFFDVKHFTNPSRKFIVHANQVAVEVLGTTFNVWQRKNQTRVVLQTGKVQISARALTDTVLMSPGELVEIAGDTPQAVRRPVDTRLYTAWKEGQLFFDGTPMQDVAALIEMQYGYSVRFGDDAIRQEKFTYKPVDNNLEELLQVLQETFRVRVDQRSKTLRIDNN
jgi:transmembrane sensor